MSLDAERILLEFQLLERQAIARHGQGRARLDLLSGRDANTQLAQAEGVEATP